MDLVQRNYIFMGRKLCTDIPQPTLNLVPQWSYLNSFKFKDIQFKKKQKDNYDVQHRTRSSDQLSDEQAVWVRNNDKQVPGRVIQRDIAPRSYLVETPTGQVRRNRFYINARAEVNTQNDDSPQTQETPSHNTRSRTGTFVGPPDRLNY